MSELLEGCRSGDARSKIFHTGDPKLVPKAMASRKVGYQFDAERVDPEGETWQQLRVFPSVEMRTRTIPKLAHEEACSCLNMLSMPEPRKAFSDAQRRERGLNLFAEVLGDSSDSDSDLFPDSESDGQEDSEGDEHSEKEGALDGKFSGEGVKLRAPATKGNTVKTPATLLVNRSLKMAANAVVRADKVRRIFEDDEPFAEQDLESISGHRKFVFTRNMPPATNVMSLKNIVETPSASDSLAPTC
jgi:hypothetical protein